MELPTTWSETEVKRPLRELNDTICKIAYWNEKYVLSPKDKYRNRPTGEGWLRQAGLRESKDISTPSLTASPFSAAAHC